MKRLSRALSHRLKPYGGAEIKQLTLILLALPHRFCEFRNQQSSRFAVSQSVSAQILT